MLSRQVESLGGSENTIKQISSPPRIRAHQVIDDLDQGGFPHTVSAKQRMDLPERDLQLHGVIGDQGAETLDGAASAGRKSARQGKGGKLCP